MSKKNNIYIIDCKKSNTTLEFFLKNNNLYLNQSDNEFYTPTKIIDDVKIFDMCIDSHENVHIICVTNSGNLVYLTYDKSSWKEKIFQSFPNEVNCIDQVKILAINDIIHIFYDFKIKGNKVKNYNYKSFIIHTYRSNNEWIQSYIGVFHQPINPKFFIDTDSNSNLNIFYSTSKYNLSSIYSFVFNKSKMKWLQSKEIKLDNCNIDIFDTLIDSNNNIHFILSNKSSNEIYHFNADTSDDSEKKYNLITPLDDNISSFKFFEEDNKIIIMWKYKDSILTISSYDYGKTWNNFSKTSLDSLNDIKYLCSDKTSKIYNAISSFGFIDDKKTFILGVNKFYKVENEIEEKEIDVYNNEKTINLDSPIKEKKSDSIDSIWKKITNYLIQRD